MRKNSKPSPRKKSIPVFVDGRRVGRVSGDTFYKNLKPRHFLNNPPGIAFDVTSLKDAENKGASKIQVKAVESGTLYRTSMQLVWEKGIRFNRGYGDQIALPLSYWDWDDKKRAVTTNSKDHNPPPHQASQLSLFSR